MRSIPPRKIIAMLLMLGLLFLNACSPGQAERVHRITIGYSVFNTTDSHFVAMAQGIRDAAKAAGYAYVMVDQQGNAQTMVKVTQALLHQGISALVISPYFPNALPGLIEQANALHIPVIIDDVGGGGTNYDALIVSDNEHAGEMAAEYMDQQIKQNHLTSRAVASITCKASSIYAQRRNAGFAKRIQELGYTVVATRNGNSSATTSYAATQDILHSAPNLVGIFVCNGPMSVASAQALTDAGKSGTHDIVLVGFDASTAIYAAIKAGHISATIVQEDYVMGTLAIALTTQALHDHPLTYNNEQDREIYVPVQLITQNNLPPSP